MAVAGEMLLDPRALGDTAKSSQRSFTEQIWFAVKGFFDRIVAPNKVALS